MCYSKGPNSDNTRVDDNLLVHTYGIFRKNDLLSYFMKFRSQI